MKNVFLSGLFLISGGFTLWAQPFLFSDLLIDSIYYWGISDEELDSPYLNTYFNAYEYDEQCRLKIYRDDNEQATYTYTTNTISQLRESYNDQGELEIRSRSTSVFENDQVVETLVQRFIDGDWVNDRYSVYYRNNQGLDTLAISSDWRNGAWKEKYRFIHRYSEEGNVLREYRYNVTDQELYLATGSENVYNTSGLKTQTFYYLPGTDTTTFSRRYDHFYDGQGRIDTSFLCSYLPDQTCEYTSLFAGTYLDEYTLQQDNYEWMDEQWQPTNRHTYYYSPDPLLSVFPDSVFFSTSDGVSFQLQRSDYNTFQELPDSRIYHYSERFTYFPVEDTTALTRTWEHWYLNKEDLVTTFAPTSGNALKVYPSPVRSGGQVTVEIPDYTKNGVLHCFDIGGRLVSSTSFLNTEEQQVLAPAQKGIYTLVFVSQGNVLAAERLIVN
jgi:hypothetical protein